MENNENKWSNESELLPSWAFTPKVQMIYLALLPSLSRSLATESDGKVG